MGEWGVKILDFRFWIKELKFNPKDALLRDAQGTRTRSKRSWLKSQLRVASLRVAMPQALRCAIV